MSNRNTRGVWRAAIAIAGADVALKGATAQSALNEIAHGFRTHAVVALCLALSSVASACGDDKDPAATAPTITFACPDTAAIVDGRNELRVDGRTRAFYADFPSDDARSMGVIFSWHGFTDTPEHHRDIAGLDPDANAELPVIVITPDDTGIQPPLGLDWDIGKDEDNVDLVFFEAILGCLNAQQDIDASRIYSYGFSAGSVMTALLHSTYPDLLSAVVCQSGAWFNDSAEADLVNLIDVAWSWPELSAQDDGAVLLTHGGARDVTVLNVLDLEASAQAAMPHLQTHGRVVVDCPHDGGHVLHPQVDADVVSAFISAHRAGTPSSYFDDGYDAADFPEGCMLRLP